MAGSRKTVGSDVFSISHDDKAQRMTLAELRHEIRNYLNEIKLSCALLQRRYPDAAARESLDAIDRATDGITELVTRCMGDADAPHLLGNSQPPVPAPRHA
jgi:nitrogen-specific signal transduction histidine kinase